jgi:hypothetical protein
MPCVDYRAIGNRNGHGFLRRIADRFLWRTLSGGEPPLILSGLVDRARLQLIVAHLSTHRDSKAVDGSLGLTCISLIGNIAIWR